MTVERNNMATVKAAASTATYIEDVFSTYLYTGTGTTQTITNNIDLSTKGGMVWTRQRDVAAANNWVYSTAQGTGGTGLITNDTASITTYSTYNNMQSFNTNGFTLGIASSGNQSNPAGYQAVSWTFRKQAKFFDIVTYTGDGTTTKTLNHNLGSIPGAIFVKATSTTNDWVSVLRYSDTNYLGGNSTTTYALNSTQAVGAGVDPTLREITSTTFKPGKLYGTSSSWNATKANASGVIYVAYLFAHNAGGFGAAGTDNIITCSSYLGTGATGNFVSLGYEPQFIIIKRVDASANWVMFDNMRGVATGGNDALLNPNLSNAETSASDLIDFNATGFTLKANDTTTNTLNNDYTYIAIRRGPMKTPTSGTSVFASVYQGGGTTPDSPTYNSGFVSDLLIRGYKIGNTGYPMALDRLRGSSPYLSTSSTAAQVANSTFGFDSMLGVWSSSLSANTNLIGWTFKRAPGFFDVVCYTGTGSATTVAHNLGVAPELMIVKTRNTASWAVYCSQLTSASFYLFLNSTAAQTLDTSMWNATAPTSSVFSVGTAAQTNASAPYVAYLFATLAGVSKVGSYTGTGAAQNINCGFASGARFVMIKRTDSTGDWYVYDTTRGISASGVNDPYLLMNSTVAEVTTTDYLGTFSSGFALTSSAPAAMNANGGTFLYLAIA